ncbi:MAG TPA: hypothetical protein VN361_12050, partial [Oxalicibacterium sp.]|nr:hypothetical protein [Oxalicibacterium sp.]
IERDASHFLSVKKTRININTSHTNKKYLGISMRSPSLARHYVVLRSGALLKPCRDCRSRCANIYGLQHLQSPARQSASFSAAASGGFSLATAPLNNHIVTTLNSSSYEI